MGTKRRRRTTDPDRDALEATLRSEGIKPKPSLVGKLIITICHLAARHDSDKIIKAIEKRERERGR